MVRLSRLEFFFQESEQTRFSAAPRSEDPTVSGVIVVGAVSTWQRSDKRRELQAVLLALWSYLRKNAIVLMERIERARWCYFKTETRQRDWLVGPVWPPVVRLLSSCNKRSVPAQGMDPGMKQWLGEPAIPDQPQES